MMPAPIPFYHEESDDTLRRLRVLEIEDIMPGAASYIFESGMRLALAARNQPINLIIRSDGGSVFEAINICNALRDIQNVLEANVIGVVAGNAFSAASYVLQQCNLRYAAPTAFLMVHGITHGGMGGVDEEDQRRQALLMRQLRAIMVEHYSARSPKPRTYWDTILKSNKPQFYTAKEALDVGLLDEVR